MSKRSLQRKSLRLHQSLHKGARQSIYANDEEAEQFVTAKEKQESLEYGKI
jgi:hypothetical protein